MVTVLKIGEREIGPGRPVFLVAEISANHNRDKNTVKRLIQIAADAGFDAVKFQTYEPLEVFSGNITTGDVGCRDVYGDRRWWEVARDEILMPREWFAEMFDHAREKNLIPFSTIHSTADARFMEQFEPQLFKVASIDVSHTEFLKGLGPFKKPVLLSTGMHYPEEIDRAVSILKKPEESSLALFHCISCYPPRPETCQLRHIPYLIKKYSVPVGFSDHSPENYMAIASVAMGACMIEKHVTLDRTHPGVDHAFSLDPRGMADLVRGVRQVECAMGESVRNMSDDELKSRKLARRSVAARHDIRQGDVLNRENLKLVRPGTGIHPRYLNLMVGTIAVMDIKKETLLNWEMVDREAPEDV
jgi:sialic acid synthase SpsE